MVQTSPKHQENPSEYLIYRPLLQIITNRPPCIQNLGLVFSSLHLLCNLYQLWRGEEDECLEDVEEVVHGEAAHQLVEVLLELLAAEHHDGEYVPEQTEAAHTTLNN